MMVMSDVGQRIPEPLMVVRLMHRMGEDRIERVFNSHTLEEASPDPFDREVENSNTGR